MEDSGTRTPPTPAGPGGAPRPTDLAAGVTSTVSVRPQESPAVTERMQALLSRAVDEQLTEQRELASVLTEVREQLRSTRAELASGLEGVTRRVELSAAPADARLGDVTDELAEQVRTLQGLRVAVEAMGAFPGLLSSLQDDISGLHGRLQSLGDVRDSVAGIDVRLGRLEVLEGLAPEVAAIQQRLDELAGRAELTEVADRLAGGLSSVEGRLGELSGLPDRMESAVGARTADLATAGHVTALGERLDEAAGALTGLRPLAERVDGLHGRADAVEQQFSGLRDTLGRMQELQSALTERLAAELLAEVRRLFPAVEAVSGRLEGLDGVRTELVAVTESIRLDDVRTEVEGLRDEVRSLGRSLSERPEAGSPAEMRTAMGEAVAAGVPPDLAEQVAGRVTAGVEKSVRVLVEDAVAEAATETERRVNSHVDDAVLALAEVLLRRRGGRPDMSGLLGATASGPSEDGLSDQQPNAGRIEASTEELADDDLEDQVREDVGSGSGTGGVVDRLGLEDPVDADEVRAVQRGRGTDAGAAAALDTGMSRFAEIHAEVHADERADERAEDAEPGAGAPRRSWWRG